MEFIGHIAYLSESEQISSGLESPINALEIDVLAALREATNRHYQATEIINADPNEGLPHERAAAVKEASQNLSRKNIFSQITEELMLRGEVSVEKATELLAR